mmetsp:Transcript_6326/g.17486  ORF Transcript_6326/g.17486 Transcript_6326/m.17486 type:complete len:222 (+) Transcript_6326:928-1593(+)
MIMYTCSVQKMLSLDDRMSALTAASRARARASGAWSNVRVTTVSPPLPSAPPPLPPLRTVSSSMGSSMRLVLLTKAASQRGRSSSRGASRTIGMPSAAAWRRTLSRTEPINTLSPAVWRVPSMSVKKLLDRPSYRAPLASNTSSFTSSGLASFFLSVTHSLSFAAALARGAPRISTRTGPGAFRGPNGETWTYTSPELHTRTVSLSSRSSSPAGLASPAVC